MEFSKELIEVFDYIGEKIGIVIDWSSENVTPYIIELCGKYINWEITTSIIWIVINVFICLISVYWYRWAKKYANESSRSSVFCIMICICLIALASVSVQVSEIIKCVTFPELQIYEFVTRMASSS